MILRRAFPPRSLYPGMTPRRLLQVAIAEYRMAASCHRDMLEHGPDFDQLDARCREACDCVACASSELKRKIDEGLWRNPDSRIGRQIIRSMNNYGRECNIISILVDALRSDHAARLAAATKKEAARTA